MRTSQTTVPLKTFLHREAHQKLVEEIKKLKAEQNLVKLSQNETDEGTYTSNICMSR